MNDLVTVLEYALLSQDAYRGSETQPMSPALSALKWQRGFQSPKDHDDFFARVYTNERYPGLVVVAYRGTVITDIENLVTDYQIWREEEPDTVSLACQFYDKAHAEEKSDIVFKLTGHSLGGALAQWVAVKTDRMAAVFNSPGIGREKGIDPDRNYSNIHNFNAKDGFISKVGAPIGSVTEINVMKGAKDALEPVWDLYARLKGDVEQHIIADVISALKKDPAIANERL